MGAAFKRPAAKGLLRECPARRHGRGFAGRLRRVLRHYGRASVRFQRRRRQLDAYHETSSGRSLRGSADSSMSAPRASDPKKVRVALPAHLRTLAKLNHGEVTLELSGPVTQRSVLDALEARYPVLRGTIRDHGTLQRRAFLRFFACEQDLSHDSPDTPLPDAIASGKEPFIVLGAIAGG